jgi:TolA-binding protein
MGAGDQYFSIADYANAARMYQLALDKGAPDRQLALVRLGIAQAEQGQLDAAKSALQQVTGARAPVAKMWLAYIATKSGAPSAAPANGA